MIIKKASHKDLSKILSLQYKAYESEAIRYNDYSIPPMTQTLTELNEEACSSTIIMRALHKSAGKA